MPKQEAHKQIMVNCERCGAMINNQRVKVGTKKVVLEIPECFRCEVQEREEQIRAEEKKKKEDAQFLPEAE